MYYDFIEESINKLNNDEDLTIQGLVILRDQLTIHLVDSNLHHLKLDGMQFDELISYIIEKCEFSVDKIDEIDQEVEELIAEYAKLIVEYIKSLVKNDLSIRHLNKCDTFLSL